MSGAERTELFLRTISNHLSGRDGCQGISYICTIYSTAEGSRQLDIRDILEDTPRCRISFQPNIKVFPNTYKRHDANKSSVIEHVLKYHFPDANMQIDILGDFSVDASYFVPGTYIYEISITGKRRKWSTNI